MTRGEDLKAKLFEWFEQNPPPPELFEWLDKKPEPPVPPTSNPPPMITASGEPSQPQPPSLTSEVVAGDSMAEQTSEILNRKS